MLNADQGTRLLDNFHVLSCVLFFCVYMDLNSPLKTFLCKGYQLPG